ncbi:glycogen debranching N-terminal domain-containing protein [Lysobacter cavernae]|uniref:Glycogen debranching N-terminal domain-containing protein n=1 Tax=Lysobacter cavernae TaxID=1685901 RepID=A0ABV7RND1_9GAMM
MDPAATAALFSNFVLKDGDSFLIANGYGDIEGNSDGQFHNDTRLLSRFKLQMGDSAPALLSSMVTRDNVFFVAHLTNRQLPPLGGQTTLHGLVHIKRTRFLCDERMYERLAFVNYGTHEVHLPLQFEASADFRDMFEVRGSTRAARGELLPPESQEYGLRFGYRGLDGALRTAAVAFSQAPLHTRAGTLAFELVLPVGARKVLYLEAGAPVDDLPSQARFRMAAAQARVRMRIRQRRSAQVRSEIPLFNAWMERSRADLALLTSELDTGPYPYAGIPWFSTPFGRDAVITALQTLWLDPGLAHGVLSFLARHQAQEESSFMDAAPGKILHETRKGEMAVLRELPFGRYYGGVDTTPLFVMLAGAYAQRTGDLAFIDTLWPALLAATTWIERVCDANPYGFLDYARGESTGLANQGWKDSSDSVFHADGRSPEGPIALIEVQGYVFAALRAMAELAAGRGDDTAMLHWHARADTLRSQVERHYWMPEHGYYGIALDGSGALCAVRGSNPGHLLYTGLPSAERAAQVTAQLLSPPFFTGWGVRTLALGEARYNPMSYHNGSVWPHDTALCAAGIARYGGRAGASTLLRSAFETAVHFDMRLPELFCGFARAYGGAPVAYPVACLPQAWAAGSAFMLLQACLGITIDGLRGEVVIERPLLPHGIDEVVVRNVVVGERRAHLVLKRIDERVGVFIEGRDAANVSARIRT